MIEQTGDGVECERHDDDSTRTRHDEERHQPTHDRLANARPDRSLPERVERILEGQHEERRSEEQRRNTHCSQASDRAGAVQHARERSSDGVGVDTEQRRELLGEIRLDVSLRDHQPGEGKCHSQHGHEGEQAVVREPGTESDRAVIAPLLGGLDPQIPCPTGDITSPVGDHRPMLEGRGSRLEGRARGRQAGAGNDGPANSSQAP